MTLKKNNNMLLNECFDFSQFKTLDIAIVSDNHGDIVSDIINIVKECDIAIHAGDIGGFEVLQALQPKQKHVLAVAGNNDKAYLWEVKHWDIVKNLPDSLDLKLAGGVVSVEHGHIHDLNKPSHDSLRKAHQSSRAIVYGHTHHQIFDDSNPDHWVINPGASGTTRTHGGAACIKLSVNNNNWKVQSYRFN
jgi:putative phosphoesterase